MTTLAAASASSEEAKIRPSLLPCNFPGNVATAKNILILGSKEGPVESQSSLSAGYFSEEQYKDFVNTMERYIDSSGQEREWEDFFLAYGNKQTALSRFLTARDGNVKQGKRMITDTFLFRINHGVNKILSPERERLRLLTAIREYWTATFFGLTAGGCPVQYHRVSLLRPSYLMGENVGEERLKVFYLWWMETAISLQRVGHERNGLKGMMPKGIEVFDFKDVSFWRLSGAIAGLRMFSRALSVGQEHYPETLRKAFVINAPAIVTLLWTVCLYVLAARTKEKIELSSGENREGLSNFIDDDMITAMFSSTDVFAHHVVDAKRGGNS
jgi:hypothetical protein